MRDLSGGVPDGLGQNSMDGQVKPGASNSPFPTQRSCQQMSDAQSIALAGLTATLLFATAGRTCGVLKRLA